MTPEEFFGAFANVPEPVAPICKLYHDAHGRVLFYSMEDLPGSWIEVDALTYAAAPQDVCVISGALVQLPKKTLVKKLRPTDRGICCDPRDICLIVSSDQPHVKWSMQIE